MSTPSFRINSRIQAKEVRLLREDGSQIGVVPLVEALSQARAAGVDAVEVAPQAVPPVVKLIDFKKFIYQLAKKERSSKAASKKVDIKEVRLTPFMAENDFQTRLKRGREFLTEGNKLRITVKFVGRQLSHREFGDQMFSKAAAALSDVSTVDLHPKWIGRQFIGILNPVKKSK